MFNKKRGRAAVEAVTNACRMEEDNKQEYQYDKDEYKVNCKTYDESEVSSSENFSEEQLGFLLEKLNYDRNLDDVPAELEYLIGKIQKLEAGEARKILLRGVEYHRDDPNIPPQEYLEFERLSSKEPEEHCAEDVFALKALAGLLEYHSPYQEVRATVDPRDDPSMPVETFRSYVIAIIWTIIGSGFNEFFFHRMVTIQLKTSVVQMFVFPMGCLWANYMPYWSIPVWKGKRVHINYPKPWNPKEQMFATLLFAIGMGAFMMHYNILTNKYYYHSDTGFGYQFFMSVAVQYMGFGFAGALRKFVVYPSRAIWPTQLQTMALNKALFSQRRGAQGAEAPKVPILQRLRDWKNPQTFFFYCTTFIFLYQWLPSYLFQALSTFNWMTWIKPSNFNLAMVTGSIGGLGFNPIASFDWNVINYYNSLTTPFFSYAQQLAGGMFAALIIIAVYWSNNYYTKYLPMFSQSLYTNKGTKFKVTEIINKSHKLDWNKYQSYSQPYYSAGNLVYYATEIFIYPCLIVYSLLSESKILWGAAKDVFLSFMALFKKSTWKNLFKTESNALDGYEDAHSKMMRAYKEVPDWWYYLVLLLSIVVGIASIEGYHAETPVWALFMTIGVSIVFLIPVTILEATTAVQLGLNVLTEVLSGYALPGNPQAMMVIKAFGYNIDGQADSYVSNLKLGHYAKIPPVALFRGQVFMVLIQILVRLGVLNWSISNLENFCQPNQPAKFTCPDTISYYNGSVIWGAIGPKRIFEGVYPIMKWCWLMGALVGLFLGIWKRWLSRFWPKWVNPIVFLGGMEQCSPPYGLAYVIPGAIANFFSQGYLRRYKVRLWEKYNYVLSAGFTAGLVFSSIIIFFAVQYKEKPIHWWGNDVMNQGIDANSPPLKNISMTPRGFFGPEHGHFS